MKALALGLCSAMWGLMAAYRSLIEQRKPRFSCRRVILAEMPSKAFSQELARIMRRGWGVIRWNRLGLKCRRPSLSFPELSPAMVDPTVALLGLSPVEGKEIVIAHRPGFFRWPERALQ